MASVVGEIDALAGIGLAIEPTNTRPRHELGYKRKQRCRQRQSSWFLSDLGFGPFRHERQVAGRGGRASDQENRASMSNSRNLGAARLDSFT